MIEDHTTHPLLARSLDTQLFVKNVEVKTPFFFLLSDKISYPELFESNYLTDSQNQSEN